MNNQYPALCHEVGLTCESCTGETARQLAKVCQGLRGKMIGQLFVQIHPDSACAPMHAHFAASYREASGVSRQARAPEPARKGPASERLAMTAAAAAG